MWRLHVSVRVVSVLYCLSKDLVVVDKGDYTNNEHLAAVLEVNGCSELA